MMHYGSSVIERINMCVLHGLVSGTMFPMPNTVGILDEKMANKLTISFYLVENSPLSHSLAVLFLLVQSIHSFRYKTIRSFRAVRTCNLLLARR